MTERDKAVEAMARAYSFAEHGKDEWADIRYIWKDEEKRCMDAALTALLTLHPSLASVLDGTGVVVPVEATSAMIMRATLATGDDLEPTTDEIRALYRAMLAARPKPADPAFDKILQEQLERDRFPRLTQRGRNE